MHHNIDTMVIEVPEEMHYRQFFHLLKCWKFFTNLAKCSASNKFENIPNVKRIRLPCFLRKHFFLRKH
jgi:hypothetical protein